MKIKTQVRISLIVFVILAAVIIFSVFASNNQLYEIQKKQQIIETIEKSSFELYYLENDYLVHGGTIPVERWNAKYAALTGQLQALTLTDPSEQAILNDMFAGTKELNTDFSNLVAVTGDKQGKEPIGASQELKEFYASTLAAQTQTQMSRSTELSQLVRAEVLVVEQRTILIISLSISLLMLFVLLNYLVINRSVLRSIFALQTGAERIGSGDLETKIETTGNDELGFLSLAFNEMSSSLMNARTLLVTTNVELEEDIAKRRMVEEALRESEVRYRELADSIADIFFAMDHDLRYTYWNKASEELTGIPAQAAIGKTIYEIFSDTPDTLRAVEVYRDVIRTHQPRCFENEHYLDGKRLVFEITAYPSAGGIAVITKDITELKRAEDALVSVQESLKEVNRLAHIGTWDWIIKNDTVTWSEELYNIAGRDPTLPAPTYAEHPRVYKPASWDLLSSAVTRALATGEPYNLELELVRPDGSIRWVNAFGGVKCDGKSKVIGLHGTVQDITGRKQAEDALRKSDENFRSIFENNSAAMALIEPDTTISMVNKEYCNLSGYTKQEVIGMSWTKQIPPEDLERLKEYNRRRLINPNDAPERYEFSFYKKNGEIKHALMSIVMIQSKKMITSFIDITGRKLMEEALRLANRNLNLLTSITRHDITNQLTVLVGYLRILEKKQPDPSLNEYFQKIAGAAERIAAMLKFTKEYEKIGVNAPAWQDCSTLVDSAAKEAPLGQIMVKNELPAGAEVYADPLVARVFYNLMDNAIRYGGKITTIRFSVEGRDGDHIVVCEDDGMGVPAEEKEKIFERGFGKNTGLGLTLSKEILSITGITIRETGEPGRGARFEMTVPKGAYRLTEVK